MKKKIGGKLQAVKKPAGEKNILNLDPNFFCQ